MDAQRQNVGAVVAGKYRIDRLIGEGGMGSVYEGVHVDLGKRVAVKIIDAAADASAELAARFRREARAASAVESDHIVQVFDVGRDPTVGLYMVMELLQGEDLEVRLRREPGRRLDPVVVAQVGYQVARALVKAHAARVIHRDLKPANIFLTSREDGSLRVKVLDFGISKLLISDGSLEVTAAGVAVGTPRYMSPEQAQGLATVDHRADVWGLGVVLYEALTGVSAYSEGESYQRTLLNVLSERPEHLSRAAPWVPPGLADVIAHAMAPEVEKRIPDAATFAARIADAVPEAAFGAVGPLAGVGRSGSVPSFGGMVAPSHPVTLDGDTQVVVRSSGADFGDEASSVTLLAVEAVPSSAGHTGRGDKGPPLDGPTVADPPLEDRTLFQPPAWVEAARGPATVKSVPAPSERPARRMSALASGTLTALGVVVVGGAIVFLGGGGAPRAAAQATAASPPAIVVGHPAPSPAAAASPVPAPPATGTVAVPDEAATAETPQASGAPDAAAPQRPPATSASPAR